MVHVVNRTGKDGSEDLEICEHGLEGKRSGTGGAGRESDRRAKISLQVRAIDWARSRTVIEGDCSSVGCVFVCICLRMCESACGVRTSRAGVDSSTWVDWVTSAAWMLLWYATSP